MLDQLRPLAVFRAVAEAGSFSRAAKRLNLSPSVVSHHVTQLEAHLGFALLYRTTRKLSLTDAGRELLDAARDMSEAAERGMAAMRARADRPMGYLTVTLGTPMEREPWIGILTDFAKAHPLVNLRLDFSMATQALEGSEFDVALRAAPYDLKDSSYKSRPLATSQLVLVAAPSYLASRLPIRTAEDIVALDHIVFPKVSDGQFRNMLGLGANAQVPDFRLETESPYAAIHMVLEGLGIGVFEEYMVRPDMAAGRLVKVADWLDLPALTITALWSAQAGEDSVAYRFVSYVAERCARMTL